MSRLDNTLASLAPGVSYSRDLPGRYNPRRGLAIYCLPIPGYSPSSPGVVLGEALAARSGLGCTLLEGIPAKIPEGAVIIAQYNGLKAARPDLLDDIPELREHGQYAVKLEKYAIVTAPSREGLASGMQTLAMLILRHNEDTLPAGLIMDTPFCQFRGLAVEVRPGEVGINLLLQMVSFAATFKANRLHLIFSEDFDAAAEIPGIDSFVQACQSHGMGVGVRVPWLGRIASGEKTIAGAWSGIRALARAFGAEQAALDDPYPPDMRPGLAEKIVASIANGDVGVKNFSVDLNLILESDHPVHDLKAMGVTGWHRMWNDASLPPADIPDIPVRLDVQAPVPGFTSRDNTSFQRRVDAAAGWLEEQPRREFMVSFRDIGVSHMWQNLLYPAATGLISAWGRPKEADRSALLFSSLLYGDSARGIMSMWDSLAAAFPPRLTDAGEALLRRIAFGEWPDGEEALRLLAGIDWMDVTRHLRVSVEALKLAATGLSRNASTLAGAKLSLHALSWLHCFSALMPELERRRRLEDDADGRTRAIAGELDNNFKAWRAALSELFGESGLELSEMRQIEAMGQRLEGLCGGFFE